MAFLLLLLLQGITPENANKRFCFRQVCSVGLNWANDADEEGAVSLFIDQTCQPNPLGNYNILCTLKL